MEARKKRPKAGRTRIARWLRRAVALGMACLAAAVLGKTAGGGLVRRSIGRVLMSSEVSKALLDAELGCVPKSVLGAQMDEWESMVLAQSAVLSAGEAGLLQSWEKEPSETASPQPVETPAPTPAPTEEPTPPPAPTSNAEVTARTLTPVASTDYDQADGVYIFNRTKQTINVAELSQTPPNLHLGEGDAGPQVLIVHTHGSEAYHPEGDDWYTATGDARTTDTNYNVVRVGDELANVLEENGISTVHDRTLYDYPSYKGSYERSLQGVQAYLQQYPSIRVVFDVHRDALVGANGEIYKPVTTVNGEQVAQVMLVMGSNDGGLAHPNWKENVRFAVWLQKRLNAECPTLARPIALRTSRYNQQMSTGSVLVEVGGHGNSLQEALGAIRLFGKSLAGLLNEWRVGA